MTESTAVGYDPNYYQIDADKPQPEMKMYSTVNIIEGGIKWIPQETKMTEFELLEELARELSLPDIEPDEVTADSVAEYTGVSWSKAAAVLKRRLAAGELTARKVRTQNGKPATAYRKAAL